MGYDRTLLVAIPSNIDADDVQVNIAVTDLVERFDVAHPDIDLALLDVGYMTVYTATVKYLDLDFAAGLFDIAWPEGTSVYVVNEQGQRNSLSTYWGGRQHVQLDGGTNEVERARDAVVRAAEAWQASSIGNPGAEQALTYAVECLRAVSPR